jgi:hypothetical protein
MNELDETVAEASRRNTREVMSRALKTVLAEPEPPIPPIATVEPVIVINGQRLSDTEARFVRAAIAIVAGQMRGVDFVSFGLDDAAKVEAAIKRPRVV